MDAIEEVVVVGGGGACCKLIYNELIGGVRGARWQRVVGGLACKWRIA